MSGILNALYCADRAMELADQYGIGMVGIRNTTHWMRGIGRAFSFMLDILGAVLTDGIGAAGMDQKGYGICGMMSGRRYSHCRLGEWH